MSSSTLFCYATAQDVRISDLEREITLLKSDNENLKIELRVLHSSLNDLKASPMYSLPLLLQPQAACEGSTNLRPGRFETMDDDTHIAIQDGGLSIYTVTQGRHLQAALVLAAMSFACWAVYCVWKIFYSFVMPQGRPKRIATSQLVN